MTIDSGPSIREETETPAKYVNPPFPSEVGMTTSTERTRKPAPKSRRRSPRIETPNGLGAMTGTQTIRLSRPTLTTILHLPNPLYDLHEIEKGNEAD